MGKCLSKCKPSKIKQADTPAPGLGAPSFGAPENLNFEQVLKVAEKKDFKDFSFDGKIRTAKCVSVYDGDTCRVVFYLNEPPLITNSEECEQPVMASVRLLGIDTPELRTKSEKEKELAKKAKARLIKLIMNPDQLITVQFDKNDKYGRPLATLYTKRNSSVYEFDKSVNAQLISEGHAKSYLGGTKESWG